MKMTCAYCSEVTECSCPEDHSREFKDAKYVCDICMGLLERGIKEEKLKTSPKRKEVEQEMETEAFSDVFSEKITEEFFEPFWKMVKKDVRDMSKKDLTKEAYEAGAYMAILLCTKMANDEKFNTAISEVTKAQAERQEEEVK